MMGAAVRMARAKVDPVEFRQHLVNAILIAGTLSCVTFMCCAATITYEVITARVQLIATLTETQRGMFARTDSLLWRIDTFLSDFKAANLSVASGLTKVRVQVKESQDAQTQQTKAISRVATESIKATESVAQAVVDKPLPVVEVKTPSATVEVKTPAPLAIKDQGDEEEPPPPAETPPPPKKRKWYKLWLF